MKLKIRYSNFPHQFVTVAVPGWGLRLITIDHYKTSYYN